MTKKLFQNQLVKDARGALLSSLANFERYLYYALILFLPTQLGYHFWPEFSYINGLRVDYLSPTIYLTDILIALLTAVFIVKRKGTLLLFFNQHKVKLIFASLLCLFLILKLFLSANFWSGVYGLIKLLELTMLFSISTYYIKRDGVTWGVLLCLSFGIIAEVILGVLQLHNGGSIGGVMYLFGERNFTSSTPGIANASVNGELILRPYATFPHPNVFSGYLLLTQIILLGYIKSVKGFAQYLLTASIIVAFIGLMLSLSRVAILLEVFVILIYFKEMILRIKTKTTMNYVVLIFIGLIMFLAAFPVGRIMSSSFGEGSYINRQELLQDGMRIIIQSPITGVGLNNYLNEGAKENKYSSFQPVHNLLVLLTIELGIPIGVILLMLYFHLSKKSITVYKDKKIKTWVLVLIGIGAISMSDHYFRTLQQGQLLFAILLGWVYGASKKT